MIRMVGLVIQDPPVNSKSVVNKHNPGDNGVKLVRLGINTAHIRRCGVQIRKLYWWVL